MLLVTTYLSVKGVSGAWLELCGPLELTRGHWRATHRSWSGITPVFTDSCFFLPVLMLAKKQIFLKSSVIWFGKKNLILYLNALFRSSSTLETNAKLKVEPKSLLTQDIFLVLIIYISLGKMCFLTQVSFQANSNGKMINTGF